MASFQSNHLLKGPALTQSRSAVLGERDPRSCVGGSSLVLVGNAHIGGEDQRLAWDALCLEGVYFLY